MPSRKSCQDQSNDTGYDSQHHIVDRHQAFRVLALIQYLPPYPGRGHSEAHETEDRGIYEEQKERLIVVQPNTRSQPWAMMIHLQHTCSAGRAMMCAIRFPRLAFLAES